MCHHWDGHCRSFVFLRRSLHLVSLVCVFLFFVMTPNLAAGFSEFDM